MLWFHSSIYIYKVWSEYDGEEPLGIEMFGWLSMAIKAKDGSQCMYPNLDSWNLDSLFWIALYMTYDDGEFI